MVGENIKLPYYFHVNTGSYININECWGKIESDKLTTINHTANRLVEDSDKYNIEIVNKDFYAEEYLLYLSPRLKSSENEFDEILIKAAIRHFKV